MKKRVIVYSMVIFGLFIYAVQSFSYVKADFYLVGQISSRFNFIRIHEILKNFQFHISLVLLFFIFFTSYYIIQLRRAKKKLLLENKRFLILANISNEIIYQYEKERDEIHFIGMGSADFKSNPSYQEVVSEMKQILRQEISDGSSSLKVKVENSSFLIFKIYHFNIDSYIFGKLIDITNEIEQKEELIHRSRIDGLTNLYNATYTRECIERKLQTKPIGRQDALLIIDLDNFKHFNDIYGHLRGDFILQEVALALVTSFEDASIIGRVGGDEFVVYLEDVDLRDGKCYQANNFLLELEKIDVDEPISASVGIKLVVERSTYKIAFEDADKALYSIKHKENNIAIFQGGQNG